VHGISILLLSNELKIRILHFDRGSDYSKLYGYRLCDTWLLTCMMLLAGALHVALRGQRRILHRSNAITSAIKHAVLQFASTCSLSKTGRIDR
jgi:predicted exporter